MAGPISAIPVVHLAICWSVLRPIWPIRWCQILVAICFWCLVPSRGLRGACGKLESIASGSACRQESQGVIQGAAGWCRALVHLQGYKLADTIPVSKLC